MKLIINIGSVDILHGVSLSDMCNDFINLVRLCDRRNIFIVITTLAPLGNRLHNTEDVDKLIKFNQFLIGTFSSKHPVIDLTKCMLCQAQNTIYMGCYQPYVFFALKLLSQGVIRLLNSCFLFVWFVYDFIECQSTCLDQIKPTCYGIASDVNAF